MKITIVLGPFFPAPPAPTGAVEYVWKGLAEAFAARGHEVAVVCRTHPTQAPDETVSGVRYIRRMALNRSGSLPVNLVKDFAYASRVLGVLPPADILVTNDFFLPALVGRLRRGAGAVVVAIARMPKGQVRLYRRAPRLAVVSRAVEEAIARENPSAVPRVRVIPNPIDTDIFVPPASGRVARTPGTMLFTGRVHPEKGLHLLIEAWRSLLPRHPGLGLRFVGPSAVSAGGGGDDYIRRLHSVAGDHEIRIDPPVYGRTALADVLREADYFCYPSLAERGETFGVAPLEAMGTGLAPVVSDLTCFRDFLEPGVNGLIFDHRAPDAVTRLSDSLDRLISDPAGAARMGEAAARTAQRFSYSAVAEQFLSDFESLLRDRAGGAGTR